MRGSGLPDRACMCRDAGDRVRLHVVGMHLRVRSSCHQLLGPGEGSIGFGGPSEGLES